MHRERESAGDVVALLNGTVVLPDALLADAVVVCRDGRIEYVGRQRDRVPQHAVQVDARGGYIAPGFIDLHVHGGAGADFMDGTRDAVRCVCRAHARHGTTTLFPTTTTGTVEQITAMLQACADVQQSWSLASGASVAGVHLYGPFFASDKAGCHDSDQCRPPTRAELDQYFDTGIVRIATCAAELPGAAGFYRLAAEHDCLVTCGHSNASWEEMQSAFDLGMRHVDHFWCAMSSVSSVRARLGVPMQGSMLEFVLANAEMSTEVIADGMHLAPELLNFAWRMKSPRRLCLVTDCNRALDMPPGEYRFGSSAGSANFVSDGTVGWAGNGNLASAVVGLDHMVRHMASSTEAPVEDVIRMATLTPAERAGIADQVGSLERGKRADVLVLSRDLQLEQVFIAGCAYEE